jgi:hypothetical protein
MFSNNDNRSRIRKLVYPLACISLLLTSVILSPSIIPSGFSKQADDKHESKSKSEKKNNPTDSAHGKKFRVEGDGGGKKSTSDKDKEPSDEPSDGDKQPSEAPAPIIITNTVTTPTTDIDEDGDEDGDDEDENEGPTRFAFIDSFFTDQTAQGSVVAETSSESSNAQDLPPVRKLEVEPGEGDSILAIVLINRGFSDVTSIRASLDFPSGFKALVTARNTESDTAMASFNGIVNAGKTFTLYFPINISNSTVVGKEYSGSLKIKYFNVAEKDEEDTRDRTLRIPIKLSGKVILDAVAALNFSNVVSLVPGEPNTVRTLIKNEGSGVATGVVIDVTHRNQLNGAENNNVTPATTSDENVSSATVQQSIEVIPLVTAGTTRFNVGTIPAGGSVQIDPIIFPSDSVGSILENMDLSISYNDAYGNRKTLNELMGVHILPSPPQSGLTLSSAVPTSNSVENLTSLPNNNIATNNVAQVGNDTNDNNKNDSYSMTQVSDYYYYNNPNLVSNQIKDNTLDVDGTLKKDNTISLVAGKVDDLNFNITNSNNKPITDAVVTLNSDSDSLKILGNSKWNLAEIGAGTTQEFVTSVFASKSLINSPVSFDVLIDYIYNGEAKSDSFNLGANVVGNITADINDLAINYIGGIPNLVGNILNKGNTLALFTTIELVGTSSGSEKQPQEPLSSSSPTTLNASQDRTILKPVSSFPQYLGDLDENSPLPFSIPLAIDNNTAPGVYPVSLKITYNDDLRNSYSVIRNGTVQFISTAASTNQGQSFLINNNIVTMLIFIIIAVALGVIFTIRGLRSRSKGKIVRIDETGDDNDFESLLGHDDSADKMDLQKK